jgi:hypothetical protein
VGKNESGHIHCSQTLIQNMIIFYLVPQMHEVMGSSSLKCAGTVLELSMFTSNVLPTFTKCDHMDWQSYLK